MSSFRPNPSRKPNSLTNPPPPSTRPSLHTSHISLLSTGVPSIDDILGGGLPLGSSLLVLEDGKGDAGTDYAGLLARYWMSMGVIGGTENVVVQAGAGGLGLLGMKGRTGAKPDNLDEKKPGMELQEHDKALLHDDSDEEEKGVAKEGAKMQIAFRYEKLQKFQTSVESPKPPTTGSKTGSSFKRRVKNESRVDKPVTGVEQPESSASYSLAESSLFPSKSPGHEDEPDVYIAPLDLSAPPLTLSPSEEERLHIVDVDHLTWDMSGAGLGKGLYEKLWVELVNLVEERGFGKTSIPGSKRNHRALRLTILSLGGPGWGRDAGDSSAMTLFLLRLRQLMQGSNISAFITFPAYLFSDQTVTRKVIWQADACIELESFAGSPHLISLFPRYSGLIHIHRLPSPHSLVPAGTKLSVLRGLAPSISNPGGGSGGGGGTGGAGGLANNLAFRVTRRKGFVVETLHLDVEGGVGERRTAPPSSTTTGEGKKLPSALKAKAPILADASMSSETSDAVNDAGQTTEQTSSSPTPTVRISKRQTRVKVRFGGGDEDEDDKADKGTSDHHGHDHHDVHAAEGAKQGKKKGGVKFLQDRPDLYEF